MKRPKGKPPKRSSRRLKLTRRCQKVMDRIKRIKKRLTEAQREFDLLCVELRAMNHEDGINFSGFQNTGRKSFQPA